MNIWSQPLRSPPDHVIAARDRRFGRGQVQQRWWHSGDPIATSFYNALSITFPRGEAFFVESVKAFRDSVPERLARDIRAFVKQEVIHSREHIAFNGRVSASGYDTEQLDRDIAKEVGNPTDFPPIFNLAATMAMEHFTAIIAHQLLSNPAHLAGATPEEREIWRWHAVEEIEHKGVAFDTFAYAAKDMSRPKRWMLRNGVMLQCTWIFWRMRYRGMLNLLAQDGIRGLKTHGRIWQFLLGKPGMLRKIFVPWLAYFLPGFHPWDEDDRFLIQQTDAALNDTQGTSMSPVNERLP